MRFSIFLLYFIFSINSAFVAKLAIGSSRSDSTGLTIGYLVDRVFHFALFNSVFRFVNMSATFVQSTQWPPDVCIEKIKILFLVLIYARLRINSFGQFGYCHCASQLLTGRSYVSFAYAISHFEKLQISVIG